METAPWLTLALLLTSILTVMTSMEVDTVKEDLNAIKKAMASAKPVSMDDFQKGFGYCRIASDMFVDREFKQALVEVFAKEYKCDIKNYAPLAKIWKSYNIALNELYLNKVQEILSLPDGESLYVMPQEDKNPEPKKGKGKPKEKIV